MSSREKTSRILSKASVISFLVAGAILLVSCSEKPVVKIGDTAEDFTLADLSGEQITLSTFRGKNIFVFFWTQGCVFCQTRNIVLVNDIYLKGQQTGLEVLSVNIAEPLGDAREFVRQKGLIFPVLLDKDAAVTRKKYGIYVVPTLFIINKEGVIVDKAYGYLSEEGLWDFVAPYLMKTS